MRGTGAVEIKGQGGGIRIHGARHLYEEAYQAEVGDRSTLGLLSSDRRSEVICCDSGAGMWERIPRRTGSQMPVDQGYSVFLSSGQAIRSEDLVQDSLGNFVRRFFKSL